MYVLVFFFLINRCLFNVETVRKSTSTSFGCAEVDYRVVSLVLGCGDKYYVLNTDLQGGGTLGFSSVQFSFIFKSDWGPDP